MDLEEHDIEDGYETDSSLDDESKQILYKAAMKKEVSNNFIDKDQSKDNKQLKVKTKKNKNTFSLSEFNKKLEEENKMIKKFVSKRAEEKKKQLGLIEENIPKRNFNPRLPPYNLVHKK
jgi:hydroxylamine reductase (hybrid-cluster protein)